MAQQIINITLGETVAAERWVYKAADNKYYMADALDSAKQAEGIILVGGNNNSTTQLFVNDVVPITGKALTVGKYYYLDFTSASEMTATRPTGNEQVLGFAIATDRLQIMLGTMQGITFRRVLGVDVTNNNASANTLADVTGLYFPVVSGQTYRFRAVCYYTAAATTTGSRWTINTPTTSFLAYTSRYTLTATTETVNYLSAKQNPAASNATSLLVGNVAVIEGMVIPSASGNIQVQFASEVSSSAITALTGSFIEWF